MVTGDVEDLRVKFKAFPLQFDLLRQAVSCPLGPCMRAGRRVEDFSP